MFYRKAESYEDEHLGGAGHLGSPLTVAMTVPAVLRISTELRLWCLLIMAFRTRSSSPRRSWTAW